MPLPDFLRRSFFMSCRRRTFERSRRIRTLATPIPRYFSLTTRFGFRGAVVAAVLAVSTLASLPGAQQVATGLPPAPAAKVVTLTRRPGSFSEPSIALNPKKPNQILAAFQVPASVAYSEDSGENWELVGERRRKITRCPATFRSPTTSWATLSSATSPSTNSAHAGILGAQRHAQRRLCASLARRRKNLGSRTRLAVDEQATRPEMPFEDKPYLVADNNPIRLTPAASTWAGLSSA